MFRWVCHKDKLGRLVCDVEITNFVIIGASAAQHLKRIGPLSDIHTAPLQIPTILPPSNKPLRWFAALSSVPRCLPSKGGLRNCQRVFQDYSFSCGVGSVDLNPVSAMHAQKGVLDASQAITP